MRANSFIACLVAIAGLSLDSAAFAGTDVDTLPNTSHKFAVVVPPGERARIDVEFSQEGRGFQLDLSIYQNSRRIHLFNNYVARKSNTWTSPVNDTNAPVTYYLLGWHKPGYNVGHDWRVDFCESQGTAAAFYPLEDEHYMRENKVPQTYGPDKSTWSLDTRQITRTDQWAKATVTRPK